MFLMVICTNVFHYYNFAQVKQLQKLGGQRIKHTVQNVLKKCFTLELAQTFSWFGRRNKKQFSELRFCTIVIGKL